MRRKPTRTRENYIRIPIACLEIHAAHGKHYDAHFRVDVNIASRSLAENRCTSVWLGEQPWGHGLPS